jgi:hypothetical protein
MEQDTIAPNCVINSPRLEIILPQQGTNASKKDAIYPMAIPCPVTSN